MKKIFISCPMRGLTHEEILDLRKRMRDVAEALIGEKVEVVPSYHPKYADYPPLKALGNSIEMMAQADYLVCPDLVFMYKGCNAEYEAWSAYHDGDTIIDVDIKHTPQAKKLEVLNTLKGDAE